MVQNYIPSVPWNKRKSTKQSLMWRSLILNSDIFQGTVRTSVPFRKNFPWPFPIRDRWAKLFDHSVYFLSESFKNEPTWLHTLLLSTCKLHFRAYLAGVIEKSDEGIQECEQCLDRLGGFSTFRWLRAPAFENNFWEPFKVKLRFGGENIYLVDNELSLADLVLVKDLISTLFIAWKITKSFKNISYVTIRSQ